MNDDIKIQIMFLIRRKEMPMLSSAAERVEENMLNPAFSYYHALLTMYNERVNYEI